jgi:mono/diheme cytochrome c family protein
MDWKLITWLGRFHVVAIHFAIALFIRAAVAESWSQWRGKFGPAPAVRFCVTAGAAGAALPIARPTTATTESQAALFAAQSAEAELADTSQRLIATSAEEPDSLLRGMDRTLESGGLVDAPPTPEKVYRRSCAACHGRNGTGAANRETMPRIPDFTDPKWQKSRTDANLQKSILDGKGEFMLPMRKKLGSMAPERMVEYVRKFAQGKTATDRQFP